MNYGEALRPCSLGTRSEDTCRAVSARRGAARYWIWTRGRCASMATVMEPVTLPPRRSPSHLMVELAVRHQLGIRVVSSIICCHPEKLRGEREASYLSGCIWALTSGDDVGPALYTYGLKPLTVLGVCVLRVPPRLGVLAKFPDFRNALCNSTKNGTLHGPDARALKIPDRTSGDAGDWRKLHSTSQPEIPKATMFMWALQLGFGLLKKRKKRPNGQVRDTARPVRPSRAAAGLE